MWSVAKTLRSQCRGLGLIPGEGTRSYMLHATNKTWHSQINKYFLKERIKGRRYVDMDGHKDGWIDGYIGGYMDGWMDGWMGT